MAHEEQKVIEIDIAPQEGAQEAFVGSEADFVFYGGAAGGGKTWGGCFCPVQYFDKALKGILVRRTMTDITQQGGMLDETMELYPKLEGKFNGQRFQWRFPSGASMKLVHCQHEKTKYDFKGGQFGYAYFDELDSFTETQFWYITSRMRDSKTGIRPFVRAGFNPNPDSWILKIIAWWINPETGYPIIERSGIIRYFLRNSDDSMRWGDTRKELIDWWKAENPKDWNAWKPHPETGKKWYYKRPDPKSFTFIPATLDDNQKLELIDPGYRATLMALPKVEREQLLHGNWKITHAAGLLFKRRWCEMVDAIPAGCQFVRGWDLAATEKTEMNQPDFTCGTLIARDRDGFFYVVHHVWDQISPGKVRQLIKNVASHDPPHTRISIPQDGGQSGKDQVQSMSREFAGLRLHFSPDSGNGGSTNAKIVRFSPFSAQAEVGNVRILRDRDPTAKDAWNDRWFRMLEEFPDGRHDDDVDSTSRAFNCLAQDKTYDLATALYGKGGRNGRLSAQLPAYT